MAGAVGHHGRITGKAFDSFRGTGPDLFDPGQQAQHGIAAYVVHVLGRVRLVTQPVAHNGADQGLAVFENQGFQKLFRAPRFRLPDVLGRQQIQLLVSIVAMHVSDAGSVYLNQRTARRLPPGVRNRPIRDSPPPPDRFAAGILS